MTNDESPQGVRYEDYVFLTDPSGAAYVVPTAALAPYRMDDALWADLKARLATKPEEEVHGFSQFIGVFPQWRATDVYDIGRAYAAAFGVPWRPPPGYYPNLD
jgi:hypothetical protein